jgi:hypothetical protein
MQPVGNKGYETPLGKIVIAYGIDKKIIKRKDANNSKHAEENIIEDIENHIAG